MVIAELERGLLRGDAAAAGNDFVLKELLRSIRCSDRIMLDCWRRRPRLPCRLWRRPSASRSGHDFLSFRPRVGEKSRWRSAQLPRRARAAITLGCG
jgi:hypothetical protein